METIPYGPLDDIKKLGEILMRRTSEKEYYRFLHIQEQCRLKWQATIEQFTHLSKVHEKCIIERDDLAANLKHISELWEREKEFRRSMECERNFYKMKLNRIYEMTETQSGEIKQIKQVNVNDVNIDEITSTESISSDISELLQNEDDYIANREMNLSIEQTSKEFDDVHNRKDQEIVKLKNGRLDKTYRVMTSQGDKRNKYSDDSGDNNECDHRVQSPPKRIKKQIPVSIYDFNQAKLYKPIEYRQHRELSSGEVNPNPIYERIAGDINNSIAFDHMEHLRKVKNVVTKTSNSVKSELPIDSNCNHTFSHRTASRSVVCFHCFKKFNFGILALKCTSCRVYVHHKCKSRLKFRSKAQQLMKSDTTKYCISDYVPSCGPSIPALIVHCVNEVETRGLSERGIYRVSGSEKEIKTLKDRFLQNEDMPDLTNIDMHVICGCIKIFLRRLREPLIPTCFWSVFSDAVLEYDSDSTDDNIQNHIQYEIGRLPKANRDTLAFLVLHLQRVATCDEVQMPISNLAKIFGPTVVGYSKQEPDHATILGETIIQQNVMQQFLNIPTDYWFSFISEDLDV